VLINADLFVLFIGIFASLVGYVGMSISNKLQAIDDDLKDLLVDHGQRITKLETRASFVDRRKEGKQFS